LIGIFTVPGGTVSGTPGSNAGTIVCIVICGACCGLVLLISHNAPCAFAARDDRRLMWTMLAAGVQPAEQKLVWREALNDLKGCPVIQPLETLPVFSQGVPAAVWTDKRHIMTDFGKS